MAFPSRILIVKTSSLGDIIQSFIVLSDLKKRFPDTQIDWAVEASFASIVSAHPAVNRTISLELKQKKNLWAGFKELRRDKYDLIFDLQGNCKSGFITWLAIGKVKVGYGFQSVREWPNLLATNRRFNISKKQNIRLFYLELIERYFEELLPERKEILRSGNGRTVPVRSLSENSLDPALKDRTKAELPVQSSLSEEIEGVRFLIDASEQEKINDILQKVPAAPRIMVCPGSKWINKRLSWETLTQFLRKVEEFYNASFLLICGDEAEKAECLELQKQLKKAYIPEKLLLPTWQNLMNEVDLVIALDSSALHLCETTRCPSFSIFGPTSLNIFKPIGKKHSGFQGPCPYGRTFEKQCPALRNCPTGACIRDLKAELLFQVFQNQCGFLRP